MQESSITFQHTQNAGELTFVTSPQTSHDHQTTAGYCVMTWKILHFVLISGNRNLIFWSILPGWSRAGSKLSVWLVAKMTSVCTSNLSNWFNKSSMVLRISHSPPDVHHIIQVAWKFQRWSHDHNIVEASVMYLQQKNWIGPIVTHLCCTTKQSETYLFLPTASISLMKTMNGESSSATGKCSCTNFGPYPKYFWMSSFSTTWKSVADLELTTARCSKFPPECHFF